MRKNIEEWNRALINESRADNRGIGEFSKGGWKKNLDPENEYTWIAWLRGRELFVTGPRPGVEPPYPNGVGELEAGLPPSESNPGVPSSAGTILPPVYPGAHSFSDRRAARSAVKRNGARE